MYNRSCHHTRVVLDLETSRCFENTATAQTSLGSEYSQESRHDNFKSWSASTKFSTVKRMLPCQSKTSNGLRIVGSLNLKAFEALPWFNPFTMR